MTFAKFTNEYNTNNSHKDKVDSARRQAMHRSPPPLPQAEVSGSTKLLVTIGRHGKFVSKGTLKTMCSNSTPKQLKLGDPFSLKCLGQEDFSGYLVGDSSKQLLDVHVAVQASIELKDVSLPLNSQVIPGLQQHAVEHTMKNLPASSSELLDFIRNTPASLDDLKERGKKVESLRKSRRRGKVDAHGQPIDDEDEDDEGGDARDNSDGSDQESDGNDDDDDGSDGSSSNDGRDGKSEAATERSRPMEPGTSPAKLKLGVCVGKIELRKGGG